MQGHVGIARLCVQLRMVVYGVDSGNHHMDVFVDAVVATDLRVWFDEVYDAHYPR